VGGHGTGAAYAARLGEAMNLHGIMELTMACATAGLVLGAVLGGPEAEYLLKRYRLTASASAMSEPAHASAGDAPDDVVTAQSLINTLFVVLLCLAVGKILAGVTAGTGLILPDFVFCLLLGVVIRNAASLTRAFRVSETTVDVVGNVALSLFLVMALMILLVMTVLGCSRGPDATALRAEVQDKLDQRFKPGLSPATLAQVLGATEKGIVGVKSGESRPGDTIKVYGSTTYEWARDRWQSVDAATAGVARVSAPGNAAPPSRSKQLIEKLAALVDIPPPGPGPQDEAVISEELDRALRAITARRERRSHVYTIASGPEAGEYHPIADALITRVTSLGETIKIRNLATHGSVENVRLLGAKEADYAFIESNIAAMAAAAEGPFAGQRTATSLRALGSLFPEPVHLVVARASGIRTVADLRGKRVALGAGPTPARGPTPSPSSRPTGSRRRISQKSETTASRPRPPASAPAASTRSSRPSEPLPATCSVSRRVTRSV
jgi:Sodium/glutamate symporter/NMT1-like family